MGYPLEAKHCGGREPIEVIIERYQPQLQWTMFVTGAKQAAISIILGANAPIVEYVERDDAYIAEMVSRARLFLDHVVNRTPPVVLPAVPVPVDASKVYDYSKNNFWVDQADIWLANWEAAKKAKEAEANLKSIVPLDAKKVTGHGVRITRARSSSPEKPGALSLREDA